MLVRRLWLAAAMVLGALALVPAGAAALPRTVECQKPVVTGVEVWDLHGFTSAQACPPALSLFKWENASGAHAHMLYGCTAHPGYPYLRMHKFDGFTLSLSGRPKEFTMSRGTRYFHVGGTDFPLNCT